MHDWPTYRITGGPHAKNLEITRDGEPMRGLHRADISFDVLDVVRMSFSTYVETGELEIQGKPEFYAIVTQAVAPKGGIRIIGEEGHYERQPLWTGTGSSLVEALENLVEEVKRDQAG